MGVVHRRGEGRDAVVPRGGFARDACFTGSLDCTKCIREATGEVIFDGVQKKWASADMVETDCTDEVDKLGQACDTALYSEFQAQYKDFRLLV